MVKAPASSAGVHTPPASQHSVPEGTEHTTRVSSAQKMTRQNYGGASIKLSTLSRFSPSGILRLFFSSAVYMSISYTVRLGISVSAGRARSS